MSTARISPRSQVRWRRLKEMLADALDEESPAARVAVLADSCAGDPAMLREAMTLLAGDTTVFEQFAEVVATKLREPQSVRDGERLGAYELVREIGRGGMGSVYLAKRIDGQFDKQVAIKILEQGADTDEVLRRFRTERQILAQLDHASITQILDAGTTGDGLPYFVMEYVDGEPITTFVAEHKLPIAARLDLFLRVCHAVEFAHAHHVVHRDVKPRNVLVRADGEPKLLDFGIAKLLEDGESDRELTGIDQRRLTMAYASPEQVAGAAATARSDVYSLGALLHELIRIAPAANAHDKALAAIIDRAMQREPAARYASAAELRVAVERVAHSRMPAFAQTAAFRWSAGVTAAVLTAAGGMLWMRMSSERAVPSAPAHASVASMRALAVLPFQSLVADDQDKLLGVGMADAIIGRMSGLKHLVVLPTAAVSRFKGAPGDAIAAGRALGTDAVLSGNVQRAGERIRVTVQLVDVSTRQTMWATTFDQNVADIFSLQDAISENVARSLAVNLSTEDQKQLVKHHTTSTAAYESYLVAMSLYGQRTKDGLARAIGYLQQAIQQDPHYAMAYAVLSDCYYLQAYYEFEPKPASIERAKGAAEEALRLDESLAEAHLALAMVQPEAPGSRMESLMARAIELNPNLAVAHQRYAWCLCAKGELPAAVTEMERAQHLDPLSSTNNTALGVVYSFARKFDLAVRYCEKAAELNPAEPFIQGNLGGAYLLTHRFPEAIARFRKAAELDPSSYGDDLASIALVYTMANEQPQAEEAMREVLKLAADSKVSPYNVALIYAARHELDEAFVWFERALEQHIARGPGLIRYDALLDPLRADPRFNEVIERVQRGRSEAK